MAMISINGSPLPNPSAYAVGRRDGDSESTTRDEAWYLRRDRVRAGMYQIEATWQGKLAMINSIASALSSDEFSVSFMDPTTGGTGSATMYAGDRKATLLSHTDDSAPSGSLWELSVSLIEY